MQENGIFPITETCARVLESIIDKSKSLTLSKLGNVLQIDKETIFDANKIPSISIADYIKRLKEYTACSDSCYVVALLYIDRVLQNHKEFKITQLSVHRLMFIVIFIGYT